MSRKVYVKWRSTSQQAVDDPVEEVWNHDRPPAELADGQSLTVFDVLETGALENERVWDGIE